MDVQHLLCGIGAERLRNMGFFKLPSLPESIRTVPGRIREVPDRIREVPDRIREVPDRIRVARDSVTESLAGGPKNAARTPCRKHLPPGTGEYTVGVVDLMSGHTVQGTFVRLFYPTYKTDIFEREAQWPLWLPRKQYGHGYAYFRRYTKVVGKILRKIGGDVYVPALWQAPVYDKDGIKFPIIVFTHGLGGNRTTYTTICCDLASHGFIVAALEHRDGSASMTFCLKQQTSMAEEEEAKTSGRDRRVQDDDYRYLYRNYSFAEEHWLLYERPEDEEDYQLRNKQTHKRAKEAKRTLDLLELLNAGGGKVENVLGLQFDLNQFKGRLDIDRAAVIGHSMGGASAIASVVHDKRFKVCVALDGWMMPLEPTIYAKVQSPVLFINTDTFQWCKNVRDMYNLDINSNKGLNHTLLTIEGTCHQSMTDFQFIIPAQLGRLLGLRHILEPAECMDIHVRAMRGFLAKHLNIPNADHHNDILTGQHDLVMVGSPLDINSNEPRPW